MKETAQVKDMTAIETEKEHIRCSKLINAAFDEFLLGVFKRRKECEKHAKELVKQARQTYKGESYTIQFYPEQMDIECTPDSELGMELFENNPGAIISMKIDWDKLTPEQKVMFDRCIHFVSKEEHVKFAKTPKLVFE